MEFFPLHNYIIVENAVLISLPHNNELSQCDTKSDCSPNNHAGDCKYLHEVKESVSVDTFLHNGKWMHVIMVKAELFI